MINELVASLLHLGICYSKSRICPLCTSNTCVHNDSTSNEASLMYLHFLIYYILFLILYTWQCRQRCWGGRVSSPYNEKLKFIRQIKTIIHWLENHQRYYKPSNFLESRNCKQFMIYSTTLFNSWYEWVWFSGIIEFVISLENLRSERIVSSLLLT